MKIKLRFWSKPETVQEPVQPDKKKAIRSTIKGSLKREIDAVHRPVMDLGFGTVSSANINNILRFTLTAARNKSRELAYSNPIVKRYITSCTDGVTGADGITIRPNPISTNQNLAKQLESSFYLWAENPELFSVTGQLSIDLFQQLVEKTRAIDGECFIRIHHNPLQIEIIDSARLVSTTKSGMLGAGNYVSNSIEFNSYGKPVAYYVCNYNPTTYFIDSTSYERVPAEEIIHYFIPDFQGQERGIPDLITVQDTLKDLSSFIEAALIQKKISASSMGFITNSNTDNMSLDESENTPMYSEYFEPGAIFELNPGQNIETINPNSGVDQLDTFVNNLMNMVAMGLNVSKQNLTMDTSNASFSAAKLSDRLQQTTYKTRINVLISRVLKPLYSQWLKDEMINNISKSNLNLQFSEYDNLVQARYIPVKHISIDPTKEAQERQMYIEMGVMSKTQVILDMGGVPEQVFKEIEEEGNKNNNTKDNVNGIQEEPNTGDESSD